MTLAPNITVHYPVTYDQGGAIKANFTWKGESVTGDSFVVANGVAHAGTQIRGRSQPLLLRKHRRRTLRRPNGQIRLLGDDGQRHPLLHRRPLPLPRTEQSGPSTPATASANDPHAINAAVVRPAKRSSNPGPRRKSTCRSAGPTCWCAKAPKAAHRTAPSGLQVKITNTACSSSLTPNNASTLNFTHEQKTTSEGKLENPFQPFGSYELCVANKTAKKRYKYLGSNTSRRRHRARRVSRGQIVDRKIRTQDQKGRRRTHHQNHAGIGRSRRPKRNGKAKKPRPKAKRANRRKTDQRSLGKRRKKRRNENERRRKKDGTRKQRSTEKAQWQKESNATTKPQSAKTGKNN